MLAFHRNEFDAAKTAPGLEEGSPTHLLHPQEQSGRSKDPKNVPGLLGAAQVSLAEAGTHG